MRTIGVVTVARSDYGIYLPILRRIQADPELRLILFVGGMHLSPEFGLTVREIERDGYSITERIEMLLSSDSSEGVSKAIGLGVIGFAQAFTRTRPDILVVLGDRFEMFAAAAAALPFNIPVAHIHGGESTEGLIDEAIRHSITKMSHLHFVSTTLYAERVVQMGEEPWRVTVSGAPSIDNLHEIKFLSLAEIEERIRFPIGSDPILVTFHPVTLEYQKTFQYFEELLAALDSINRPVLFTYPNADTQGHLIIQEIDRYVSTHLGARVVTNLGTQLYFSLMKFAQAMVGNSSSGIIEAASLGLPVVNIGNRQRGRLHGPNVIDVPCERLAILEAIKHASSSEFRATLVGETNPYGDGHAAEKIVLGLRQVALDEKLIQKRFYDLAVGAR